MRFLLDEAVPFAFIAALRSAGHEVEHIILIGMPGAPDPEVFAHAVETNAVLLTPDLDFSDERDYLLEAHPGIVIYRLHPRVSPEFMAEQVRDRIDALDASDVIGNIVVIEAESTRIRRKPA